MIGKILLASVVAVPVATTATVAATGVAWIDVKGYSERSIMCESVMLPIALNMLSIRPGCFLSQSRIIALICTRCRFSWLPQRLHGMIGNRRCAAHFSRSVSAT